MIRKELQNLLRCEMSEYVAYVVKVGTGYLTTDKNASLYGPEYKLTFRASAARWFSKEYVFDIAKRYGGQAIGLLPVLLEDEV